MSTIVSTLPESLYLGNTVPEVLGLYEEELREGGDFSSIAHATSIKLYRELIEDRRFLSFLRREFDNLYKLISKKYPSLCFNIEGRRKSLISSEDKIVKLLNENRSLDLFRDMFAFRIILFGCDANSLELINTCYNVMNEIITFYVGKGLTLCEEDPVVGTMSPGSEEYKKLLIPDKTKISKTYLYGVKDYILNPKKNGYQSLHSVLRINSGYCFEVQVRTFGMHVHAVDGNAEHSAYKLAKYANRVEFDRSRIHIPGYGVSPNGKIFDFVGLEKPLSIFRRQKTF